MREDYSPHGTAWDYCTHDQARSRAHRRGEDGLVCICATTINGFVSPWRCGRGWTGLVAKLIQQFGEYRLQGKAPELIEREYSEDSCFN